MAKNFLNPDGLKTLLNKLAEKLAIVSEVEAVEADTETYVTDINYSELQFETTEIVEAIEAGHTHSYRSVTTAPTCTTTGYTTYTCTCGNTYVANETAAKGHTYSNGTCTVCGAEDPDYERTYSFTLTANSNVTVKGTYTNTITSKETKTIIFTTPIGNYQAAAVVDNAEYNLNFNSGMGTLTIYNATGNVSAHITVMADLTPTAE